MSFTILIMPSAHTDMADFNAADRMRILETITKQLSHQPDIETRNRKRLRPNPLANWELRIGQYRAFYDIDGQTVTVRVVAIGEKVHNRLFIRGREVQL